MKFGNLTGKIKKNIETIGLLGGVALAMGSDGTPVLTRLEWVLNAALSDPHIPNFENVRYDLLQGTMKKPLFNALKVALIGELASAVGLFTKYANLAKKGGWAAVKGVILGDLLIRSTIWHSPTGPESATAQNFANAPQTIAYGNPLAAYAY